MYAYRFRPFAGETRLWITCASILHRPKYVSTLQLHNDTARLFLMDVAAFERLLPSTRTAAVSCDIYRICPYRSRAQIEAGARIEAGGQEDKSLIEAGSQIEAGLDRSSL